MVIFIQNLFYFYRGNINQCNSCDGGANRYLSSGYCYCNAKYYDDGSNEACVACHYQCKNCNG